MTVPITPTAQFVTRGAYSPPLGRPLPTAEDKAEAERLVARHPVHWDPVAQAERVESCARCVQQKRLLAEHKAALTVQDAVEGGVQTQSQSRKAA